MAYEAQFYPGATSVAENRRKHMSGKVENSGKSLMMT